MQDFRFCHRCTTHLDRLCIVIGTIFATAVSAFVSMELPPKNNETIIVAFCTSNSGQPLFRHANERVPTCRSTNCIKSNIKRSISTILESNWERQSRCQFSVKLRFRSPCPYSSKRQQIGEELHQYVSLRNLPAEKSYQAFLRQLEFPNVSNRKTIFVRFAIPC
jgi:hypothetical protein